ncbi:MAG: hypothetical protein KGR24_05570 [Planctomycetes bacterium]|nr:hypothetical protein [Planctomycetota bacterium]
MADKQARGIVASSFVAGLLLAAVIFAPRAWDPVPEPFFGLDDPPIAPPPASAERPAERLALNTAVPLVSSPAALQAAAVAAREALAAAPVPREQVVLEATEPADNGAPPSEALPAEIQRGAAVAPPAIVSTPLTIAGVDPEPTTVSPIEPPTTPPAAAAALPETAAPSPLPTHPPAPPSQPLPPPESLRALVTRVQAARPAAAVEPPLPRRISPPPAVAPLAHDAPLVDNGLGAAPLPGDEWVDPDRVNWSDVPLIHPGSKPTVPVPRLSLRSRLRVGERLLGRDRPGDPAAKATEARTGLADIRSWPVPQKLLDQLDGLASSPHSDATRAWSAASREQLTAVLDTAGPRDPAAPAALVTLGEAVHAGMGIADVAADHSEASATRRAALALARRIAVWRAATGLCADAASSDIRLEPEIVRLLDAIERFEISTMPEDAAVAARSAGILRAAGLPGGAGLAKAVHDHYLAANVRLAIHQRFLEKLLPGATVTTGSVDDVVLGRKVRGTRTVQRTTTVRFVPDADEICFDLEVHGDVESRTVTESGPVSLTSRGASAFTVRKPIKVSTAGLLFGTATGVASNRSQLANVQTSFDSVPFISSLVRNIARNQHEETLPEANREVIDHIVSKACREVDAQAEPKFVEISDRIRERVWEPLVRLGLEPTPVAMETTATTATLRLRLAADDQLAAHTPRPRAPTDALFSLQVNESTLNNALERLGLAGRRFSLEELLGMLYERAGFEPRIPDDLPEGVFVSFARRQPLRVECRDGLVHMRVALDAIESGRRSWYDIVAQVAYKPAHAAPQVFLEREGPVQLSGPGHQGRIEFALRTIFSKIFPKERPIPVLPDRLVKNPQLEGLMVLQAVSTDGWLALGLGLREGETTVAQPAANADKAADRRPRIFR